MRELMVTKVLMLQARFFSFGAILELFFSRRLDVPGEKSVALNHTPLGSFLNFSRLHACSRVQLFTPLASDDLILLSLLLM